MALWAKQKTFFSKSDSFVTFSYKCRKTCDIFFIKHCILPNLLTNVANFATFVEKWQKLPTIHCKCNDFFVIFIKPQDLVHTTTFS